MAFTSRRFCKRRCVPLTSLMFCIGVFFFHRVAYNQPVTESCGNMAYPKDSPSQTENGPKNKKILLWTSMWSSRTWRQSLKHDSFIECPEQRCEFTIDRCQQSISDAVLFYMPNLLKSWVFDFPPYHPSWQTWVLGIHESEVNCQPGLFQSSSSLDGKFNWIYSHRFDADIYLPYFHFLKILDNPKRLQVLKKNSSEFIFPTKQQQIISNYTGMANSRLFTQPANPNINYAQKKTRIALWFVSNCKGIETYERIKVFQELTKYVTVDVYGRETCRWFSTKDDPCRQNPSCALQLMSTYKFYLSFENSQCNHYISEKFANPLRAGTVPIAFGAPLKDYEAIAPKDSFLHVSNFTSVKALADYMKYLDENDEHYNRYYKWKESHVLPTTYSIDTGYKCKLCSDLWNTQKKTTIYKDFSKWWNRDTNCIISKHSPFLHKLFEIKNWMFS